MSIKLSDYTKKTSDGKFVVERGPIIAYLDRAYEKYKRLKITDKVSTLGIFTIEIGDKTAGFCIPGMLTMCPSSTEYVIHDGIECVKCTFEKGDVFIDSDDFVRESNIAYVMFTECLEKANIPKFMSYDDLATLFDMISRYTGFNAGVNHAGFEMLYAYLTRSANNLGVQYRYTDMKQPPYYMKLKDVPHVAQSTTTKLLGAYLTDSMTVSMVNASDDVSDVEELLRR